MTPTDHRCVRPGVVNAKDGGHRLTAAGMVAALLFLVLCGWQAMAGPDLIVVALTVEPSDPLPGATVLLTATLENIGNEDADTRFSVRFEVDGHRLETGSVGLGLGSGRRKDASTSWVTEEGPHVVSVEADQPFDRISEDDESNNVEEFDVLVPYSADIARSMGGLRVAVGPFEDRSASGLLNVGDGVADKLSERLTQTGIRTVHQRELLETMQQQGLNPYLLSDVSLAAGILGADLLVTGSVIDIDTSQSSISLGPFSLGEGAANVSLAADVINVPTVDRILGFSAEGSHRGSTELSIDLDALFSLPGAIDVCGGGLRTDRNAYHGGETVSIGYLNPSAAAWYSVEIHTTTGSFLQWLGWEYTALGGCGTWFWDQRDSFSAQVSPSVYVAKLWDGSSYTASQTFQIQPGISLFPLFGEIALGSMPFEESIFGGAVNEAVDRLVAVLVPALTSIAASAGTESAVRFEAAAPSDPSVQGQVAAILPDGRIAINIGSASGVSKGDFFEVVDVEHASVRGQIVIVEVRDHVSYAVTASEFDPAIGDIIRWIEP